MRRAILGLAAVLGVLSFASSCPAQFAQTAAGFSDPFFLYYGFYLPRQAALAAQPGPEIFINQNAAARREAALVDRAGLYGPIPTLGEEELDPSRAFGQRPRVSAAVRPSPTGISSQNLRGAGPPRYFNRHGTYYPTLTRSGRGSNQPPALRFSRGGSGIGVGVPY
jgi:hypothetical protein